MTLGKKLSSVLLPVGCAAVLAVGVSPASAQSVTQQSIQWGPQAGSVGVNAVRQGARIRVSASISLPAGASVSGKLQLGKRVLCRAARKKQVTEEALTEVSCSFPTKLLKTKRSRARSSQTPTQQQYAKLIITVSLAALAKDAPPVVLAIPLALWSLVATSND